MGVYVWCSCLRCGVAPHLCSTGDVRAAPQKGGGSDDAIKCYSAGNTELSNKKQSGASNGPYIADMADMAGWLATCMS